MGGKGMGEREGKMGREDGGRGAGEKKEEKGKEGVKS
jgi:hypothetical protein